MSEGIEGGIRLRLRPAGRDAAWIVAAAAVYFAMARLSMMLLFQPERICAIWPASGVVLAALLLTRRRLWPWLVAAVMVTGIAAETWVGTPLGPSLAYAVAGAGNHVLGAWLLLRFVGSPFSFRRARDVFGFLALSVIFSNGLFSLLAAAASTASFPGTSFWPSWAWWAASDGIGNLVVTPLILSFASPAEGEVVPWNPRRALEAAVLLASLGLLNLVAFSRVAQQDQLTLLVSYLSFPFLLWAALRFDLRVVSSALALLAAIAVGSLLAQPPAVFPRGSRLEAVILVQLYLAAMAIPSLLLAAVVIEQRRAQKRIRESQGLLQTLVEGTSDAIFIKDVEGRYVLLNSAAARVVGKSAAEVIGKGDDSGFPAEQARAIEELDRNIMRSRSTVTFEERITTPEGEATYLTTKGPMVDDRGNVGGLFGIARDITQLKRDEHERQKLQAQLQQAMKMEAVGRLAGGVAHDFNNILTAILGNVGVAISELPPSHPVAGDLAEAQEAALRAVSLTKQLLAFSRKQIIEPRILDLNEMIAGLHPMLSRLIGEDVALRVVAGKDLGAVRVDPGQFEQILVNLAVNARDAMPGGGALVVETSNVDLDELYCATHPEARAGRFVMLAVSDTGHGMTAEVKAHLFEPFFTTKPLGRGTGLGVSMTYGAVRQAGGSIEVYSEVGKGTTFKIYLPRIDGEPEELEGEARAGEMPRGTETVLLVEDDAIVRRLGIRVLKRLGYAVLDAANGDEAIALAGSRRDRIDLLITDVVMPGLNGRELAERLTGIHPETKVLFTSGYTDDLIVHHGVLGDAPSFIGKPYSAPALARKIREVLDGGRPRAP